MSNFFGPKLYNEGSVNKNAQTARALSLMYSEQAAPLSFKNPVLGAFSNAIWHCASAAEVSVALNEAAAKAPQLEQNFDTAALQSAFDAAKNWPPKRPPELTSATYQVVFSDGVTQETRLTPAEIENWVAESNKADANKPYRIVRVLDPQGRVVWDAPIRQGMSSGSSVSQTSVAEANPIDRYREAAERGDAEAQFYIAEAYYEGDGIPQDCSLAAKWWLKAAEQGCAATQYQLGCAYSCGEGVSNDYIQAYMWFTLEWKSKSNVGPRVFYNPASDQQKRELRKLMTPSQVATARQLEKEWRPKTRSSNPS